MVGVRSLRDLVPAHDSSASGDSGRQAYDQGLTQHSPRTASVTEPRQDNRTAVDVVADLPE